MEKSNMNEHIGKTLQRCRLQNKLTQNQVAELTNLEPRYISQIERGLSKGSIDTLIKLCNAYHITPDVVLFELLDDDVKRVNSTYDFLFQKLNARDKDIVLTLVNYLVENE